MYIQTVRRVYPWTYCTQFSAKRHSRLAIVHFFHGTDMSHCPLGRKMSFWQMLSDFDEIWCTGSVCHVQIKNSETGSTFSYSRWRPTPSWNLKKRNNSIICCQILMTFHTPGQKCMPGWKLRPVLLSPKKKRCSHSLENGWTVADVVSTINVVMIN